MKRFLITLCLSGLFALTTIAQQQGQYTLQTATEAGFKYNFVTNDPLQAREYTLSNGMKVFLTVYKDAPRIQTYIAVKAGSKNDPAFATGLAHYLEHILFKGSTKIGTANWEVEKGYITKIEDLYETYRKTTDTLKRVKLYHQIDSISGVAAKYAIPNEYDKLMGIIGAQGTNAYTFFDQTVYVNDIPANQLMKWAQIESERFSIVVPRLFHTELEAVYEEKNRGLDSDGRKVWETTLEALFPTNTYGTQTTIGTVEHLKNPSIKEIKKFFDTYYVPNNMAICLSGDLDPATTLPLLEKYFSTLKPKPVPAYTPAVEKPLDKIIEKTVTGPDAENITISYRFAGRNTKESMMMELLSHVLYNGQAGLIDLDLNQKQKVLDGSSYPLRLKDYSVHMLSAKPREGQTLEHVKKLLIDQIDAVQKGNFPDWLLAAIINDIKISRMKEYESNASRADAFVDAFTCGMPWSDYIGELAKMEAVTKAELIEFAKKYYSTNYVAVYKKVGVDAAIKKVPKPKITPVSLDRDTQSPFLKKIVAEEVPAIKPVFIDFQKDIRVLQMNSQVPVYYKKNEENGLFDLYYVFDMGSNNSQKLSLAVNYLEYLGTGKYSAEDLKKEFYKIGCTYTISVGADQTYVALSGLSENFLAAMKLFESVLNEPKPDKAALNDMIDGILKERGDSKLNKGVILRGALVNYGKYGKNSPFTNILSAEQLKAIQPEELCKIVQTLCTYKHNVVYYGPVMETQIIADLDANHKVPVSFFEYLPEMVFTELPTTENKVYFVNYDMVQAEMIMLSKSITYDSTLVPAATLFNQYFGGDMSSIVFQEIRESKALAYAVRSNYSITGRKDKPNYVVSYIGTQADKLKEAADAVNALLNDLPKSETSFENAKAAILSGIESERITKSDVIFEYFKAKKLGLHHDIRQDVYKAVPGMKFEDIKVFHDKYLSRKPQTILLIGSKDKLNFKALEPYGKLTELSLTEIFSY